MFKKCISFFLIFTVFLSCIGLVFADQIEYQDFNKTSDFLVSSEYIVSGHRYATGDETEELHVEGNISTSIFTNVSVYDPEYLGTFSFDDFEQVTISWKPIISSLTNKVYFYFTEAPYNRKVSINGTEYSLNFSDSSTQYFSGYVLLPRFMLINSISVTFDAHYTNANNRFFTSAPGVISAFGFVSIVESINTGDIDYSEYRYYWDTDDLLYAYNENVVTRPFDITSGTNVINYTNDFYHEGAIGVLLGQVVLAIDLQSVGPDVLDSLSINYDLGGDLTEISAWVSSGKFDQSGFLTGLPVNNVYSNFSDKDFTLEDAELQDVSASNYTAYIDLENIDLKPYRYLMFSVSFDPIELDRDFSTLSYFRVNSIFGSYVVGHNFSESSIISGINGILNTSNDIMQIVIDIKNLLATSDDSIEDGKEVMQQQSSQVNELNNTLDSVPKNDIDIDSLLGNTLTFNPTGIGFLSAVTNNKYITAILTLVFTLALVGYIFFGKR